MKRILLMIAAIPTMSVGAFAQCASFPCVVATASVTNNTTGIDPTTLYTPPAEGTFRVSVYMSTTGGGGNSPAQWFTFVRWVDRLSARNAHVGVLPNSTSSSVGTTGVVGGSIVVHDMAGQPLEYRVGAGGFRYQLSHAYDLYIVVEQLQ
jgi:hypothetical protein